MNTKSGRWNVGGNEVHVCVAPGTNLLEYSQLIDSAVLYGILRRGDWTAYLTPGWMTGILLLTDQEVRHYKMRDIEFDHFLHYYCGQRHKELDWRKCGF